ncbi:MAG: hypothetical protein GY906_32750 [bacterium]|nr:hypothetical protein [bacterium]
MTCRKQTVLILIVIAIVIVIVLFTRLPSHDDDEDDEGQREPLSDVLLRSHQHPKRAGFPRHRHPNHYRHRLLGRQSFDCDGEVDAERGSLIPRPLSKRVTCREQAVLILIAIVIVIVFLTRLPSHDDDEDDEGQREPLSDVLLRSHQHPKRAGFPRHRHPNHYRHRLLGRQSFDCDGEVDGQRDALPPLSSEVNSLQMYGSSPSPYPWYTAIPKMGAYYSRRNT